MQSTALEDWKIILLSGLGGALEFYDFVVFAIFAMVIGETFFPSSSSLLSTISAFGAFGAGYLARPLGGVLFSHFGDKTGRKKSFILSISMMAVATILMGILPGVESWGYISAYIFIALRLVQGLAIGGEIPGAITFVQEHIAKKPGLACGVIFLFINSGILLGDIVRAVLTNFMTVDYAWRIAFIIGGFLAVISYFLRTKLSESPEFEKTLEKHNVPLFSLFKLHPRNLLASTFIVAAQAMLVSVFFLYIVAYMKIAGNVSAQSISYYTLVNVAIFSLACGVFGWISDYFNKKYLLIIAITLLGFCSFLLCSSIINKQYILEAYILCSLLGGMYAGIFSAYIASLFSTSVKFSGIAVSYNVGFAIFGGLSPVVMTYFIHSYNNLYTPAIAMVIAAIIALIGLTISKPFSRVSLEVKDMKA